MELAILGWAMRVIEDFPSLQVGFFDESGDFAEGETVEIIPAQMTFEEMFRIWDVLPVDYRVSATYVARMVRIDSNRDRGTGIVMERDLRFAKHSK